MDIENNLGFVEKVFFTVLVDNKADLIVESSKQVKIFYRCTSISGAWFFRIDPAREFRIENPLGCWRVEDCFDRKLTADEAGWVFHLGGHFNWIDPFHSREHKGGEAGI